MDGANTGDTDSSPDMRTQCLSPDCGSQFPAEAFSLWGLFRCRKVVCSENLMHRVSDIAELKDRVGREAKGTHVKVS